MKRVTHKPTRMQCVRGDGKVSPHEARIRAMIEADPTMHRNGFWTAIRFIIEAMGDDDLDDIRLNRFVPDTYRVDHDSQTIEIYEVEGTNRLSEDKLRCLVSFWNDFDCLLEDWTVKAFAVDVHGTPPRDLRLDRMYYAFLDADPRSTGAN